MHWRHVSITMTPFWGSRLVALRARIVLAERIGTQPLSQCAGPGQPGGMACSGWPSGCMLGDGARGSATFDPQRAWTPFCDVICIRSIATLRGERAENLKFSLLLPPPPPPIRIMDQRPWSYESTIFFPTHRQGHALKYRIFFFLQINPLKTSPEYTRAGVYGECVL